MAAAPSRTRTVWALVLDDRRRWSALAVLMAVGAALRLAGPLVVRDVVDRATGGAGASELRWLAFAFLVVVIAAQLFEVLVARLATDAAWRTTNDLRLRITRHVLSLDHEFHRRHTPGELIQRVDGDVTSVSEFLGRVVPKAAGSALVVAGMIVVLSVLDWRLGLGMLAYVAVAAGVVVATRQRAVSESADEMSAYAQMYGGIEERLNAAEDLRASGAAGHAMWRFVEDSSAVASSAVRTESAFLRMWWMVQGAVVAGTVVSIAASTVLVGRGLMSIGTAFMLFQYVLLIERPLEEFVDELDTVQKADGAMRRVGAVMAIEPSIRDLGTVSPPPGPLSVEFNRVTFDYSDAQAAAKPADGDDRHDEPDDERSVLDDVSVSIAAGRSVGVVGRTGSGKTTFSRLVLRLVEPVDGTVRLGGVPIADIPLVELRRRVALVPQEVELFAGTIRDNVTLFESERHGDDAVRSALAAVGLTSLLEGDIDRQLGAGGAGLSAGEAQLIAMARVWLRDPDVVVLDEATARVDPETEARIEHAVRTLIAGRTTIVIAHRLSTLRAVDDIIVLEHGRVVEAGPRADLAADPASRFHRLLTAAREHPDQVSGLLADDPADPDDRDDREDAPDDDRDAHDAQVAR